MARYLSFIWTLVLTVVFSTFLSADTFAQTPTHTLSGRVRDVLTGEYILGANVINIGDFKGVSTNLYGFYSLQLPEGENSVSFTFIGYKTQTSTVDITGSMALNIELEPATIEIGGAEVLGSRSQNTQSADLGRIDVSISTIKSLPALMGEVDILKVIQLLPGIQSAGEGNSGFYVRGGGPDQNLILLDNATIYNASHLFGFFSVFNADAIQNVDIHKGAMPARYGGRISSVLDIGLREGNRRDYEVSGGIGLISSRITTEGPIVRDKSSFIFSSRRTYIDILTKPLVNNSAAAGSGYYFYDLNAKLNHRFSEKDEIFLSGYFGRDVFSFSNPDMGFSTSIPWGNAMGSFRWNHLFNDKVFLNVITTYSDYEFAFTGGQEEFEFGFDSGIEDWNVKTQLSYYPSSRHKIKAGIDYVYHTFNPINFTMTIGDEETVLGVSGETFSHETSLYLEDEWDVSEKLKVYGGVRYSDFCHVGPFTRFPANGSPDTVVYAPGEVVKRYGGWEPRVSARLITGPRSSVKAGYNENYQYVHLASLSGSTMPMDVWLPSSDVVAPQWGRQISAGYFTDLGEDRDYEMSVEGYYKDLENLVEYAENTQPTDNMETNTDNNLVFGDGWSYGAEFFLKKRRGDLNGWIGYTWSKTEREFADLNNGEVFPATYDRRHDLSLVLDYTINENWRVGLVHVYATGNSITLPAQMYMLEGTIASVYGDRNGYRMDPYHRVDISATLTPQRKKEGKRLNGHWVFSIYNVYNRANPYFIFFAAEGSVAEGNLQINAKQVSLFPILPSFTWNFKF